MMNNYRDEHDLDVDLSSADEDFVAAEDTAESDFVLSDDDGRAAKDDLTIDAVLRPPNIRQVKLRCFLIFLY